MRCSILESECVCGGSCLSCPVNILHGYGELEARWIAEVGDGGDWRSKARAAEAKCDEALDKIDILDDHRRADSELIDRLTAERDEARSELELERGQKKADLLQDLAEVTVALRDLIDSVTATKTRDAIVLRDLEAARALIGEGRS